MTGDVNSGWEAVIGLEVHAQIVSESKLFSSSPVDHRGAPNSCANLVDLAFPGMLPVLNGYCVEQAVRLGLALGSTVHKYSAFDRKNYFYPDLPSGYQISQFYNPIITGGVISIEVDGASKNIRICRAHMEQDAGKSVHDISNEFTCLDFNRAGVGLLEIVSEPDLYSAQEAVLFIKKLQSILRYTGVCTGDMEDGALRCDANVSVKRVGSAKLGTRCEIKNLNSLASILRAVEYEISQQIEHIEGGGEVVQYTKLFDVDAGVTRVLRPKEDSYEYKYFNDPDLPPLIIDDEYIQNVAKTMPELPDAKRQRYEREYGLSPYDAGVLIANKDTTVYFESALCELKDFSAGAKILASWVTTELFGKLNKLGLDIKDSPIDALRLSGLVRLMLDGTISGKVAKQLFDEMMESDFNPEAIVKERGLEQIGDEDAIGAVIDTVLAASGDKVAEYRGGKDKLFGYFVGQVMQKTKGRANPEVVGNLLRKRLDG